MNLYPGSVACNRPKMSEHRGRTWDYCTVIAIDDSKVDGYLDTSWGQWFYFKPFGETQWRKARVDRFMTGVDNTADFRELKNEVHP